MKRKITLLALTIVGTTLFAQSPILKYETHALVANTVNNMTMAKPTSPGEGGAYSTWDFSGLEATQDFVGTLSTPNNTNFQSSTTDVEEFGNKFFFNVDPNKTEYLGNVSSCSNATMIFDQPIIKIKYPFAFGDNFSGNFTGRNIVGTEEHPIRGVYEVKADAFGKLILPNNVVFENTLRVVTKIQYVNGYNNSSCDATTITYQWYVSNYKFPLITIIERAGGSQAATVSTVAYTKNAPIATETEVTHSFITLQNIKIEVAPNPFVSEIEVRYKLPKAASVKIEILDYTGRSLGVLLDEQQDSSEHDLTLTPPSFLSLGNYLLQVTINGEPKLVKLVKQ